MSKDENKVVSGALYQSLSRTNAQIRQERGDAIAEDLEMTYKREVEDIEMALKRLERKQVNMFDFSPTNAQSLVMAKELDSQDIKDQDMAIGLQIRNTKIRLDIAKKRYEHLFGKTL